MEPKGFCRDRFDPVREAFARSFERGLEVGASVAVTHDGEPVVDLWGGDADPHGTPWAEDTIVCVFSTTKTMVATCVLVLADRGDVDLSAPVARYWPEFAQNGKETVEVRHLMSHSAGLPGFDPPLDKTDEFYDWDNIVTRLAAQTPWWEPGTASGYHATTQGYLLGEVVRRVTGHTLGTFFREDIAEPLGADFHIGLDPAHDARVGQMIPPTEEPGDAAVHEPGSIMARMLAGAQLDPGVEPRTTAWRRAEIPSGGGFGNARSVARVHSVLACGGSVDGVRLLSEAGVARVLEEQTYGTDLAMGVPIRIGMGFTLNSPEMPISPNDRAFVGGGWGGSLAIIDLDARVSIAYVMNRMEADPADRRGARLAAAVYRSLA